MVEKIDEKLVRVLQERNEKCSSEEIAVILTLREEMNLMELEEAGFKLQRRFEIINAISGLISPSDVENLVRLSQVEKIEFDEETTIF
jgi:hypothetical protein